MIRNVAQQLLHKARYFQVCFAGIKAPSPRRLLEEHGKEKSMMQPAQHTPKEVRQSGSPLGLARDSANDRRRQHSLG